MTIIINIDHCVDVHRYEPAIVSSMEKCHYGNKVPEIDRSFASTSARSFPWISIELKMNSGQAGEMKS
jgi:hypothetical protein